MKIIFVGTPEFGAAILENLTDAGYKPALIITETDKPTGRKQIFTPSVVKTTAQKYGLPILQPDKIGNCKLEIENLKPDLIIVVAYGKILPKSILNIPKYGCLNIHPSLLPKYRGPSPIQETILRGDDETGVTIILMNERMDEGPIVSSSKVKVQNSKVNYIELHNQLAELGEKLLVETIPKWINGEIKAEPQDDSKASYTKIIKKEDGRIDWTESAEIIERQIRAFNPWPSSFTDFEGKNLKILKAEILDQGGNFKSGEIFLTKDKKIGVQTGKNCLVIEELQLAGKNRMTAKEFLNGYKNLVGTILG